MHTSNAQGKRVAVVTGSSSGIGYATSVLLAKKGFQTYATMRNLDKSASLQGLVNQNASLRIEKLDVSDPRSIRDTIRKILSQENGRLDVLINNAGYDLIGCAEDVSLGEIKAQFETNFFGVIRVTRAVLPSMRKNKSGIIVNISSISGRVGWPAGSAYVSSKFALEGLSECMFYELRKFGIKVIIIEPGAVRSKIQNSTIIAKKAKRPSSPYSRLTQNIYNRMACLQKNATPAEHVADLIFEAITSPTPNLRYSIGNRFDFNCEKNNYTYV